MKDLTTVSSDLFNKIRSRFSDIKIGDEAGALTNEPEQARFFDVNYTVNGKDLGRVNLKIDDDALTVIYNHAMTENEPDSVRQDWFAFLRELRQFAKKNMLGFDTRDITKSNLDKRDYQYLSQDSGELKMSESKLFGTSKTSYQDVGEAKIIVKHSAPVNYDNPAGRTQRIESIYIESNTGERFRYPHKHLNGARAMARHVANGGTVYDEVGGFISGLSEELGKLRQFRNYVGRNPVMSEAFGPLNDRVLDRIDQIKHELQDLQKQVHYEKFKTDFQPAQAVAVPDDTASQWVETLTVKSFNEELKSTFPFIYKLMSEKREDEVTYEDIVDEETCPTCHKDPCECDDEVKEHNHLEDFEQHLEDITTFEYDVAEGVMSDVDMMYDEWMNSEYAPFDSDSGDDNAVMQKAANFLAGQVPDHQISDYAEALANAFHGGGMESSDKPEDDLPFEPDEKSQFKKPNNPNRSGMDSARALARKAIPKEVVEFIASMYDRDQGTFPRGEEGVKIAVEKKFGEQAGQFANFVVEKLSSKTEGALGRVLGTAAGAVLGKSTAAASAGGALGSAAQDALSGSDSEDDVDEGGEFGAYWPEQLAQKVFDIDPNLDVSGKAEKLIAMGYEIAKKEVGDKRASYDFSYDEDFTSDFASAYSYLQKQGDSAQAQPEAAQSSPELEAIRRLAGM